MYATYLLDLTIRNVRCFGQDEQTLRLSDSDGRPAPWTVILGDNGVGKTTLLQCLVALEPRRHFRQWGIGSEQLVRLPLRSGTEWRIHRDPAKPSKTLIQGRAAIGLSTLQGSFKAAKVTVPTDVGTNGAVADERLQNLRCCAYGATRRLGLASLGRNPEDPATSLFQDGEALLDAEEWLLVEDYAQRRSVRDSSEHRLERIKKVLISLLPDAKDLRIAESGSFPSRPSLQVQTPYGWVALSDLSLGYRTMIAWTVDLASRLFMLYPDSPDPLAEPAVVLVDEVDLHLHPKWQRELRSHLTDRFPNVQFVVTAHSPLVVQASENENIVVLRRDGDHVVIDNDVETVRGWRVDQVLTSDLFGLETARPPEYDALIKQRNEMLTKGSLNASDRALLDQLEDQIEQLPAGETTAERRAMEIISRAAAKLDGRHTS